MVYGSIMHSSVPFVVHVTGGEISKSGILGFISLLHSHTYITPLGVLQCFFITGLEKYRAPVNLLTLWGISSGDFLLPWKDQSKFQAPVHRGCDHSSLFLVWLFPWFCLVLSLTRCLTLLMVALIEVQSYPLCVLCRLTLNCQYSLSLPL